MSYKILQKQEFLLKSNACEFCVDTNARRVGMPQLTLKRFHNHTTPERCGMRSHAGAVGTIKRYVTPPLQYIQ